MQVPRQFYTDKARFSQHVSMVRTGCHTVYNNSRHLLAEWQAGLKHQATAGNSLRSSQAELSTPGPLLVLFL
ncbi:hypothetical protein DT73_18265 [Mangrovibacter sp. MFB070]|nr:hypothetical protein DT73_18265 [Mangrovibacter sp. MFB070]